MTRIDFVANNGAVGGGEVMLLAMARAANEVGYDVRVVGPQAPAELQVAANDDGFDYLSVGGRNRRAYLVALTAGRGRCDGDLVWCNGLLPSVAFIASRRRRVVHLHQQPTPQQKSLARLARLGARATVVPSRYMASVLPGSIALENWCDDLGDMSEHSDAPRPVRVGFIGRFSQIKGLDVLAKAVADLQRSQPGQFELVLAGDGRFVPEAERNAVEAALSHVQALHRLGWVDRQDFLKSVDLVVVPSVWEEPFGLVAAEAMAARRPVIVTDRGALREIVGIDHPWVAVAGSAQSLAATISAVTFMPAFERRALVEAARRRWESCYSPMAGGARLGALLGDLLGSIDPRSAARPRGTT